MRAALSWVVLGVAVASAGGCGGRQGARSAVYYSGGTPDGDQSVLNPPTPIVPRSCTSDSFCNFGEYCVKAQFSMTGYCAIPIDRYGRPILAPRPIQMGPAARGDCRFLTDCPIGLHCDAQMGATPHCVR
jgi:hypothetical protein